MSTAFRVQMQGSQEVPPTGSSATGLGTVVYDSDDNRAQYDFTITGLDFGVTLGGSAQTANPNDNVTALHVHNAAPGATGGVVFGQIDPAHDVNDFYAVITPNGSTNFNGRWDITDGGTSINTFAPALAAATPGTVIPLYFNLHTSGFPGGEIRGQWICIADDNANNVAGTGAADSLPGLGGNDTVNGFGGDDNITGDDNRDRLTGGNGVDRLQGGTGKDFLRGDAGADSLIGGGGKDRFIFELITDSQGGNLDQIFDFNPGIGELIDVSAIDADVGAGGNQAFVIVGSFTNTAGEAVLTYLSGPNFTAFELDDDGDGVADFAAIIYANHSAGVGFVL